MILLGVALSKISVRFVSVLAHLHFLTLSNKSYRWDCYIIILPLCNTLWSGNIQDTFLHTKDNFWKVIKGFQAPSIPTHPLSLINSDQKNFWKVLGVTPDGILHPLIRKTLIAYTREIRNSSCWSYKKKKSSPLHIWVCRSYYDDYDHIWSYYDH